MSQLEIFKVALDEEIGQHSYGSEPAELYEPIRYLMDLQGKRLRPMLAVLSTYLFTDHWQQVLKPAHAVEVFHNFTLMHDDIMDHAPLRRGMPTVHEKWNENTAILSGDVMLVQAYELFLGLSPDILPQVLKRFNKTASEVCEGQQLDMNFEKMREVSIADYINMIRLKTSVLLGFSMELGGWAGRAEQPVVEALYAAGENMGLGFQIKDDLLDVYGDPGKFGKQIGGDILSDKKTFLYLKALELADTAQKEELTSLFSDSEPDSALKVKRVTGIYNALGIKEIAEEEVKKYFEKAIGTIRELSAPDDRKRVLLSFVNQLWAREK
ncbi:polyprenyl synthetase family protein [Ravibacter arvi]|uniref:Polyprenyl synthetase family protein n=1 Tax=Ravibacter arvi TaxID=2051041 RepID=A0ABP8LX75_9BACT